MVGASDTSSSVILFTWLAAQGMGLPGLTSDEKLSTIFPPRTFTAEISITSSQLQEIPVVSRSNST